MVTSVLERDQEADDEEQMHIERILFSVVLHSLKTGELILRTRRE
jgi:hypothetical protein